MNKAFVLTLFLCFGFLVSNSQQPNVAAKKVVYLDQKGIIRWSDTNKEVSLYGANYCLPSACDYRAAGYVTSNRKKVIDQDMAHFARMSFDAVRLCLWGDYENSDKEGNLLKNDHLDLMDYLIAKAKERGIYMLLSPIVTYSSQWPDAMDDTISIRGSISATYKKNELGINPKAIAAQCNFISQLLNHINPYTGIALKNEPAIVFVEMINEPAHHSKDLPGSVSYINALVDAVRRTGCQKLVFHNVSQDFSIVPALAGSNIQGATFAWYPSGLNSNHTLTGNFLPVVDEFSEEMLRPELSKLGRIVYEFDSPDQLTGYMYPAMARSFRRMGAQWASIFSYDMLATAPYNLGWQTHYINMVYTPEKALSAMIAAEVMRTIPMYKSYGKYPDNTTFGNFRLNYDENLGELNSPDKFYYTNNTQSVPVALGKLTKIAGFGSSSVVSYEGKGIYFLDKINNGTWRLEVYPDALQIRDPFEMPSPDKIVTRSISRSWPMSVHLPGLGDEFNVLPVNEGNNYSAMAAKSSFAVRPGVYILTSSSKFNVASLPSNLGFLNMKEFVSLPDQSLPLQVISRNTASFEAGKPLIITADVYSVKDPESVTLYFKTLNSRNYSSVPMKRGKAYVYEATVPWNNRTLSEGRVSWCIVVKEDGKTINFPSGISISPGDWNFSGCTNWDGQILSAQVPIKLVEPQKDLSVMAFTRIGDGIRSGIFKIIPSTENGDDAIHLELPLSYDRELDDYTVSVVVGDKIAPVAGLLKNAKSLTIAARGNNQKQEAYITLVEKDGTSWSSKIPVSTEWRRISIPIKDLQIAKGAMLPLGYPGRWNYWFTPAVGRGRANDQINLANIERVQISMRQAINQPIGIASDSFIDISSVELSFRQQ